MSIYHGERWEQELLTAIRELKAAANLLRERRYRRKKSRSSLIEQPLIQLEKLVMRLLVGFERQVGKAVAHFIR